MFRLFVISLFLVESLTLESKTIYLIKNAEAYLHIDTEQQFGEKLNSHLTIFGNENAKLLSIYLSTELHNEIGNIHYFQNSIRSKETAEAIIKNQPEGKKSKLIENDLLSTYDWGDLTGQTYQDFFGNKNYHNKINPYEIIIPNGDSLYDVLGKINNFLVNFWTSKEKIITVISDSLILNVFAQIATQSSLSSFMNFEMANCGISKITMSNINNYKIDYWNDSHFLKQRERKLYDVFCLHFTDFCNFRCRYCYTDKGHHELSFDELKKVVDQIRFYFDYYKIKGGRISIAGGEPLLYSKINELIDYIYEKKIGVSVTTNGYFLSEVFIQRNKDKIQMIGISIDSLLHQTNIQNGRRQPNGKLLDKEKLIKMCKLIKQNKIKLKINTVLSQLNLKEDFNAFYEEIKPDRVKVLQMLCDDNDKKNVELRTTKEEMELFIQRHKKYVSVGESAESMINSYLIVNSEGFLDTNNWHKGDQRNSLLTGNIIEIMDRLEVDAENYEKRYENKTETKIC